VRRVVGAAAVGATALTVLAACASARSPGTVVTQAPLPPSTVARSAVAATTAGPATTQAASPTTAPATTAPAARPSAVTPATPVPAPTSTVPTPPAGIAGFDFGTFTHDLDGGVAAPLVKGEFQRGASPSDADYLVARLQRTSIGDLDGDGADEAAAEVYWTTGGTGQFVDVLVYEWDGSRPVLAARAGTGDRAFEGIRRSYIDGGTLVIERLHGRAACCPEKVERRAFTLDGTMLRPDGPARTWAWVLIADADTPIRFLPGTSGAYLSGDVTGERRGSFAARAGQTLTLEVTSGLPGEPVVVVDLVQGDTMLGTAGPGAPLVLRLPTSGGYAVVPRVTVGGAVAPYVEAILSIG
jgi:hypothetical protein